MIEVLHGDSTLELSMMPDNSIDSIVTDPPYGISFMGKHWDYDLPNVDIWKECLRVLKPGGHMLVACGTRTQHRMAVNVEDAGFEIRDTIAWIYGSGFPKSLNVSKAIDKAAKVVRKVVGKRKHPTLKDTSKLSESKSAVHTLADTWQREWDLTAPATKEAEQWEGWGTALKPAMELWTLARKPMSEKTIAENVIKWGTGAINITGCRVETNDVIAPISGGVARIQKSIQAHGYRPYTDGIPAEKEGKDDTYRPNEAGRFPANLIHDGSAEVLQQFPDSKGQLATKNAANLSDDQNNNVYGKLKNKSFEARNDSGSAARFFYCAKASKSERNEGLEGRPASHDGRNKHVENAFQRHDNIQQNHHPTVKPVALMQYLCRLITPPGGTVLDPFAGSGTTGVAAKLENFSAILIEREAEYIEIINKRTA